MKPYTNLLLALTILLSIGCFSKKVKVEFHNESKIHLDSILITINNYSTIIPATAPFSTTVRSIPQDSININPHDVHVQAIPYDKNKTNFKGGNFYNDLFMPNQSVYTLILRPDSTVVMKYDY